MNTQTIRGKWHEMKGKVKSRWGRLTDDDMTRIEGDVEHGAGYIQKRYGLAKDDAEREWDDFWKNCEGGSACS